MGRTQVLTNGFRYYGSLLGENVVPRTVPKQVASAYGTAIFKGDPVKKVSDGTVAISAAGDPVYGIVVACHYLTTAGVYIDSNYVPASISYTPDRVRTIVDIIIATPMTIFEAQSNAAIADIATARGYVDENVDHVATAAGNTGTGLGGYQLAMSTHNTTTSQWRLFDISPADANDVTVINHRWLVIANETHNLPGAFSATGI